jgi:DNA-binding NarL/FixJ family response regulator
LNEAPALTFDGTLGPLSPLALQVRRVTGAVVGRPVELAAIQEELASARSGRLSCLTAEGEPGIGKTRLLLAASELAAAAGCTPIAVAADEELRGPFLLARAIFACPALRDTMLGTEAREQVDRALNAVSGQDEPGMEGLLPDAKLVRTFDLAAVGMRALAAQRPVALLVDDLQWADEDSIRLLRYVVRADAANPIFLMLAIRPEELAFVNEAVTLIADMERMGLVRRLKLGRFTQVETGQFLDQVLAGKVNPSSAAAMHAQAEGVPFIIEELAHTYRDTGMIQQIDGVWTLARNAERLVPSAVRTLIQRRAARLPETTKASLAEAAILGRSFSLQDLRAIKLRLGDEGTCELMALADALAPAVSAGLMVQHPEGSPADYSFTHDSVREFATAALTPPRKRAIHGAMVEMLTAEGDPPPASLAMLARHAMAAGDAQRCAEFAIGAALAALRANAPEEVLRVVDLALPAASTPQDRVALLIARDDALEMLRRPEDRLEGLAELAALAEALSDLHLELAIMLRRAAAFRLSEEEDRAAALTRRVRDLAAERGDRRAELEACLELGQDLLRSAVGEGFVPTTSEADLDGAEEAYQRAVALAMELGDEASVAGASRELGTISVGRIRAWFVTKVQAGEHVELLQRVAGGESIDDILPTLPVAPIATEARTQFERALEIYERLGDRHGAMSTIVAMAYVSWGPDIHLPGSAKRIEEIRRLSSRMRSLTKESERALWDAQMLYGVEVYALAKVFPDLALSRGREAHQQARVLGDRSLEFASAGGVAIAHLSLGEVEEAEQWLGRAAAAAAAAPTSLRARQLEAWRGMARAEAGDAAGMREHLERALRLATDQGLPAARCEALAQLALASARLGADRLDEDLLSLAEKSAVEAESLSKVLPGHPPWAAGAQAARARVALARGALEEAAEAGRMALSALQEAMHEDLRLEIVLPAARAVLAGGTEEEQHRVRDELRLHMTILAQRMLDEDVRIRWFRGPIGRELTELAGPVEKVLAAEGAGSRDEAASDGAPDALPDGEVRLLELLVEGRTNKEIAQELGLTEQAVDRLLGEIFAKLGASSRAEATAVALMGKVL